MYVLMAVVIMALLIVIFSEKKSKSQKDNRGIQVTETSETSETAKEQNVTTEQENLMECIYSKDGKSGKGVMDMAHGLRVWDEHGTLILDTQDRLPKVLGEIEILGKEATGSLYDEKLSGGEFWWVLKLETATFNELKQLPRVYADGNRVHWSCEPTYWEGLKNETKAKIVYGVY